eukprot:15903677-Heterocapsa_arctica.AAC.1
MDGASRSCMQSYRNIGTNWRPSSEDVNTSAYGRKAQPEVSWPCSPRKQGTRPLLNDPLGCFP